MTRSTAKRLRKKNQRRSGKRARSEKLAFEKRLDRYRDQEHDRELRRDLLERASWHYVNQNTAKPS